MAELGDVFESDSVVVAPRDLIPNGTLCELVVTDSSVKRSDGKVMISLTFTITEGEYEGRKIFENVNYVNPSEKAQLISRENLKRLCDGTGVSQLADTSDLHDKPFVAKIKVEEAKGQYEARNLLNFYSVTSLDKAPKGPKPAAGTPSDSDGALW